MHYKTGYHQGMSEHNKRHAFAMLASLCCMFIFADQALAAQTCQPSITATTPARDFLLNTDGTVVHLKTGLMWKRCSEGQAWDSAASTCTGAASTFTWQAALQQAQTVNNGAGFAGHMDWRVPNIKELASIAELQCTSPAINATVFPVTQADYWSSSPVIGSSRLVLGVGFGGRNNGTGGVFSTGNGDDDSIFKDGHTALRLVRGGP